MKRMIAIAACLAVLASGCTLYEARDYGVSPSGLGVDIKIHKDVSTAIVTEIWYKVCNTNAVCTGNWLHDNTHLSGWGAAQWYEATHYYNDLWLQTNHIWFHRDMCLGIHVDITADLNWMHYDWDHGCYTLVVGQF